MLVVTVMLFNIVDACLLVIVCFLVLTVQRADFPLTLFRR